MFRTTLTALSWLGRQGTRAVAALVFIGIAVPPIDALLKPFVTEAIFGLLFIAFLRVDPASLRTYLGRPGLVIAATAWTALGQCFRNSNHIRRPCRACRSRYERRD